MSPIEGQSLPQWSMPATDQLGNLCRRHFVLRHLSSINAVLAPFRNATFCLLPDYAPSFA
jgi:hypothetical protein